MNRIINARRLVAGSLAAASFGLAAPALAQSSPQQSNLTVSATVTANCSLSTSPVEFGDINTISGSSIDAAGGITVTCTGGTAWTASAGAGSGSGATLLSRRMTSGSNTLNYMLYTNSGRTTIWGDGTGTTGRITGTGSGSSQAITVYGRIPSGQGSVPAGIYGDTVQVTLSY